MKKAVVVCNLNYSYNGEIVLKKLNFCIDKGNFFVILGPNGSGKTTLIRLIAGLEKLSEGIIKIMDLSLSTYNNRKLAQTMAYVPQNISIDFPFTVSQVVHMGRSPHLGLFGITSKLDQEIAIESMRFTGVSALAHRKMCQLSGGERQRVFIAKAICQQSHIIVLDEPTAALDVAHQIKIMDLMDRLIKEKGITVIMVSHDINLAAMYCDNLLLIKSGCIVKKGSPEKVLKFQILEKVYGCPMLVDEGPFPNIPRITPVPSRYCVY